MLPPLRPHKHRDFASLRRFTSGNRLEHFVEVAKLVWFVRMRVGKWAPAAGATAFILPPATRLRDAASAGP